MKRRRRDKKSTKIIVPVASMGDIAFLLIIFFMVCSNFTKEAPVQLDNPTSLDIAKLKESSISVAVDKEGEIYLQGQIVPTAEALEWGVLALIEGKESQQARTVMFKCDQKLSQDVYLPVLDAIAKAGAIVAAIGESQEEDQ